MVKEEIKEEDVRGKGEKCMRKRRWRRRIYERECK